MRYLNNFIACTDVHSCGNENEINDYFARIKNEPGQKQYFGLKSELKEILGDNKFDYINFLENDDYASIFAIYMPYPHGYHDKNPDEVQNEAKKIIVNMIWNKLYPDDKIEM